MKKNKVCVSISSDVYKDIEKYAAEREISFSVAVERMLIKGLESINVFKEENLVNQLKNILSNSNVLNETKETKEEVKEEVKKEKTKEKSEDDLAIFNIFDSMPD